jgi:hypothetical protein
MEEQTKKFRVARWCCTSGNCDKCCHLGFGKRLRVVHMETDDRKFAEAVVHNWREYGAELIERE